jgi:hypothetical protein
MPAETTTPSKISSRLPLAMRMPASTAVTASTSALKRRSAPRRAAALARPVVNLWMSPELSLSVRKPPTKSPCRAGSISRISPGVSSRR